MYQVVLPEKTDKNTERREHEKHAGVSMTHSGTNLLIMHESLISGFTGREERNPFEVTGRVSGRRHER